MTDQTPPTPPPATQPDPPRPTPRDAPEPSATPRPVQYKGEPLDADRGPGLGCFRFQVAVLAVLVVLTPLTVAWRWPEWVSAALLFAVIVLLLVAGQTIIFLLRLVAADRRAAGRRRPLTSQTKTVGELEDERRASPGRGGGAEPPEASDHPDPPEASDHPDPPGGPEARNASGASDDAGPVRQ